MVPETVGDPHTPQLKRCSLKNTHVFLHQILVPASPAHILEALLYVAAHEVQELVHSQGIDAGPLARHCLPESVDKDQEVFTGR